MSTYEEIKTVPKFGRLKPSEWGTIMPVHSPLSEKGPWYYRDTEAVIITYQTDPETVLDFLPEDVELIEPATAFMVIETNHWTTLGPYSEVYTAVLCKYQGEVMAYCNGVYVTGENSQILGREVYGFGKKQAHRVELIKHQNGEIEAIVEVTPGNIAAKAVMRPSKNESAEVLESLPLLVLKVVPDAEGGDKPSLAQLVSVLFKAEPHRGPDGKDEVYVGKGSLVCEASSDVGLPVLNVLDSKFCRFTADLPYGKILKTY